MSLHCIHGLSVAWCHWKSQVHPRWPYSPCMHAMLVNLHVYEHVISDSFCMSSAADTNFTTPVLSNGTQTPNVFNTSDGLVTGILLAVAAFFFVVIFVAMVLRLCYKKTCTSSSSVSLTHERYTTQPPETLQNSCPQRDLTVPPQGENSEGDSSEAQYPEPPCPAYAAQDLPPDYYRISKDNPPAYQTVIMMPSVINPPCSLPNGDAFSH